MAKRHLMRKPTPEQFKAEFDILWNEPEKYIELITDRIRQNPSEAPQYSSRARAWERLGNLDKALEDFGRSIALKDNVGPRLSRGSILMRMGHHQEALEDFNRAEALDPDKWVDQWGPLHRADCHAKLGNEAAALADCARLPDEFWSPGIYGEPRGNKGEIIAEVRRRARAAKRSS